MDETIRMAVFCAFIFSMVTFCVGMFIGSTFRTKAKMYTTRRVTRITEDSVVYIKERMIEYCVKQDGYCTVADLNRIEGLANDSLLDHMHAWDGNTIKNAKIHDYGMTWGFELPRPVIIHDRTRGGAA